MSEKGEWRAVMGGGLWWEEVEGGLWWEGETFAGPAGG